MLQDICLRGAKCGKKNFSVKKCFLPVFYIVALDPAASLELYLQLLTVHITLHGFYSEAPRKLHVSVQAFLCFFYHFD